MVNFSEVLKDVKYFSEKILRLNVIVEDNDDHYFKGDLDGKNIWIASHLQDEHKLFCLLHLIGHSIQWNVSDKLRKLGSQLWNHPSEEKIKELQNYEWRANCYGLTILEHLGYDLWLDDWLYNQYIADMNYLTHYYRTGEKLKELRDLPAALSFAKPLEAIPIPLFKPKADAKTRKGIVINF